MSIPPFFVAKTCCSRITWIRTRWLGCVLLAFSPAMAQEPAPVRVEEKPVPAAASGKGVRLKTAEQISIDITPPSGTGADGKPYPLPANIAAQAISTTHPSEVRNFAPIEKRPLGDWNFAYQPLLFEEVNAERYGEICPGWQPALSVTKFYTRTLLLPYSVVRTAARQPHYFPHADRPGYSGLRE
jgi:hypothetical protein